MTAARLNIAVVEDHADLCELFTDFLIGEGYAAEGMACADDLDDFLQAHDVDLLVLDLNLPGEDGFSIAKRLRESHPGMHIVMITARTALEDRIHGYSSGADVYLTKPVAPAELGAAVGSIARRVHESRSRQVFMLLDPLRLQISGPAGEIGLTPPEICLLKNLAEAPNRKLDYWRLYELLDLEPDDKSKAMLEVRISRMKKKLHEAGAPEPAIKSVWKTGYQLCVPVRIQA